jgi:hypothetical protein
MVSNDCEDTNCCCHAAKQKGKSLIHRCCGDESKRAARKKPARNARQHFLFCWLGSFAREPKQSGSKDDARTEQKMRCRFQFKIQNRMVERPGIVPSCSIQGSRRSYPFSWWRRYDTVIDTVIIHKPNQRYLLRNRIVQCSLETKSQQSNHPKACGRPTQRSETKETRHQLQDLAHSARFLLQMGVLVG